MGFRVGSGSVCQAAEQSTWGTPVTPNVLLNMTGESINVSKEMGDEGNLLAVKTAAQRDLLAIVTEGGIDQVLRPETVDWLFKMALGVEAVAGNVHTFTLAAPNQQLPFSTIVMDRGGIVKTYPDITIRSITIEAPAQDYVRVSIDFVGTKEIEAGGTGAQTIQTLTFTKPSYRCTAATLLFGAGNGTPATQLCVESCTIKIDNGVEDSPATYCSGLYNERPLPGLRTVTVNANVPYDTPLDNFRNSYYMDVSNPKTALKLKFTTSNPDEYVEILLPNVVLTEAGGNVGGTGIIDASFAGEALSVGATEPITITVNHDS